MGFRTGFKKVLGIGKEEPSPTRPDAQALRNWREQAPSDERILDQVIRPPQDVFTGDDVEVSERPGTVVQSAESFADVVQRDRERLGVLNPERGYSKEHELAVAISGIPNIGPDGRFPLWGAEGEDGEIHPELQVGYSGVGKRVDARKALDTRVVTTLKEYSPFHSRAWMGEYHYSAEQSVTPERIVRGPDGRDAKQRFPFPVPRQVKVHGTRYVYDSLLGQGGMGGAVKYVSPEGKAIVLKVAVVRSNAAKELRAIEETTYHAVLNPELDKDGEPLSPLAQNVRRADGKQPDLANQRVVKYVDSVFLQTRTKSGSDQRAIGTFIEYLPGGSLNDNMQEVDPNELRVSTDQEGYHQLLEASVQDGIDLAEGLMVHHAAGIEHRDMKAANVVRGEDGHLRIIDPGIARGETVRALRAIDEQITASTRGRFGRSRVQISRDKDRSLHDKVTNDMQGLYTLAVTRGIGFNKLPEAIAKLVRLADASEQEGFKLKGEIPSKVKEALSGEVGTYEHVKADEKDWLSFGDQVEIWNWLRDWQRYQYEPMSAKERKETLLGLVKRLHDEDGLVEKHFEGLMSLPDLDPEAAERGENWAPSEWRPQDIGVLEDLDVTEKQGMDIPPVETTDSGVDREEIWKTLADSGNLTAAGSLIGTPQYMSPEQIQGEPFNQVLVKERVVIIPPGREVANENEEAEYKSDIFSLGMLLFKRTGMGTLDFGSSLPEMAQLRVGPTRGITIHEKDLLPEELRAELDRVANASIKAREQLKDPWAHEKRQVQVLLQQKGKAKLLGLLRWMTLHNPLDRPAAAEVRFVMMQVKKELGEEDARSRAEAAANSSAREQVKKVANG